ncbi:MAG: hypothetical protein ABEJ76_00040 [Halanaeroarchaeum sp.]
MPSITRRETLAAAASGLAMLAGCAGSETESRRVPPPRGTPIDYAVESVRLAENVALFARREATVEPGRDRVERQASGIVSSESELAEYEFAAGTAARRLHDFAAETDFDRQAVFLHAIGIGACYDVRLRGVREDGDGDPRFDFCRSIRPADVACEADAERTVGFAVRFETPGGTVSGLGTSFGRCNRPTEPPAFDATVTVSGEGDDE